MSSRTPGGRSSAVAPGLPHGVNDTKFGIYANSALTAKELSPGPMAFLRGLMDRRLLVLALGMFALGTDSFVVAGVLPEIAYSFDVSIGTAG